MNSIDSAHGLIDFFEMWETETVYQPEDYWYSYEVIIYDDATGDEKRFEVWAESEDLLREDIVYYLPDSMAIEYISQNWR